jgi:hypothetical protein
MGDAGLNAQSALSGNRFVGGSCLRLAPKDSKPKAADTVNDMASSNLAGYNQLLLQILLWLDGAMSCNLIPIERLL